MDFPQHGKSLFGMTITTASRVTAGMAWKRVSSNREKKGDQKKCDEGNNDLVRHNTNERLLFVGGAYWVYRTRFTLSNGDY